MRYVLSTILLQVIRISDNMYILLMKGFKLKMIIKLRETLNSKNKSIYWLSKETKIAASTLSRICNNKTSGVQFSVLDKICQALDCEISDILEHEKGDTSK